MSADGTVLGGVIPPLTTPLNTDGEVDTASMERLCGFLMAAGVDGLFVGGSSGEAALLSDSQRCLAVEIAVGAAGGQVPVVAGAVDTGTARVIDHAVAAAKRGAAAVVSTGPFYVAPHPDEVTRHFRLISAAVDVPVIAYDIPSATHTRLPRSVIEELSTSGTIAGLKDSSGDLTHFRQILQATAGTTLRVFTGSETVADLALRLGAHGQVPGLGNVDPDGYVRLGRAAAAGDWRAAAQEQDRLLRLFTIVDVADRSRIGFTAGALGAFKVAQYLRGVIASPRCADPLLPLVDNEIDTIRDILVSEGIHVVR
jgi:4-hydroxy-tetrahydrodipicolinate synthase